MKDGRVLAGYFCLSDHAETSFITRDETGFGYYSQRSNQFMKLHPMDSIPYGVRPAPIDYHFNHEILYRLHHNQFELFPDALVIDQTLPEDLQSAPATAMLGSPRGIIPKDIAYISVESIQHSYRIYGTRFTEEDRSWIESHITFKKPAGGELYCSWDAIGFQEPSETARVLLKELSALGQALIRADGKIEEARKIDLKVADVIDKLRQERVIITSFCAC